MEMQVENIWVTCHGSTLSHSFIEPTSFPGTQPFLLPCSGRYQISPPRYSWPRLRNSTEIVGKSSSTCRSFSWLSVKFHSGSYRKLWKLCSRGTFFSSGILMSSSTVSRARRTR
uniref:Uncharacterized protein n=1 Tax=Anguilla anguilla TaxID=7936 RepID=A0A0E9XLY4_ANGAN